MTAPDAPLSGPDGLRDAQPDAQLDGQPDGLLDALPDGLVVAGADGAVRYVNTRAARLLGRTAAQMVGERVQDLLPLVDEDGRDWWRCIDPWAGLHTRTGHRERRLLLPGVGHLLVTMAFRRAADRRTLTHVLVSIRDSGARGRDSVGDAALISMTAHELRSPLVSLVGFTGLLLRRWSGLTDSERRELVGAVEADAHRLSRLIRDLLEVSRLDSRRLRLAPQRTDLGAAVAAAIQRLVATGIEPHRFTWQPAQEPVLVWADPQRLDQILANLLENAVRHGAGQVSVGAAPLGSGMVQVWVADQGPGIPEPDRPHLFTRFWKGSRSAGTGLGLYLVRGLVEAHGGVIQGPAGDGPGAEFRFTLPAVSSRPEHNGPAGAGPHRETAMRPGAVGNYDRRRRHDQRSEMKAMSGPNTQYDPVQVAALSAPAVDDNVAQALAAFAAAGSLDELKAARLAHQGEKSPLALANREIGALPPAARAEAGKRVGAARARVSQALAARQSELEDARDARILLEETIDVTVRTRYHTVGARHPISLVIERIQDVFVGLGWEIAEGPELESEWLTFDALNLGPDHPARQLQDTFYVDPPDAGLVLRTHTSPVQVRSLLERPLPLYVAVPGKVFRTDELDATHTPVFHQVEGLAVDEGLTMAHLKGTLDHLAAALFGADITTRLRPSYFPFTEPSAEMDLRCFVCRGSDTGCRTCGGTGWIEWGGCGMVNRNVLIASGVDPERYTGFAFGMGLERSLMQRHGIADMRDIVEGDVRFSTQFGMEA